MTRNVQDSILNLSETFGQIGKLEFRVRNAISSVVLASNDEFEARCIRDADEAELSLFQPASENNHRDGEDTHWASGPAIVKAQPIVDCLPDLKALSKAHSNPGDTAVTRSYLMAIKKLLDVYPQPRLAEHVEALSRQLDTLQDSISDMQSTLNSMANQSQSRKAPMVKKKTKAKAKKSLSNQQALEEIEDLIQHEQLEILALTDLRDEKRAEVSLRKVSEKIMQAELKTTAVPSPAKLKAKKTPSKTRSLLSDVTDPFVLSRTESLRRSIRRIQSPHIRNELPVIKRVKADGIRPRGRPQYAAYAHTQVDLAKTTRKESYPVTIPHSSPIESVNQPNPSPCETVEAPKIPESRLNTIHRLNAAFWKSATMTDPIFELCPNLKQQCQKEDNELIYQDTIFALNRLLDSYPASTTLTPAQVIEVVLYKELMECLSAPPGSTMSGLEAILHEEEWCVPLEAAKALLVKACERFGVDVSLNRTVVYFLVGKAVIRIERRASPIAICIC
ncbi:hypothetical protein VP01_2001g2 [Puccinia sorghi]|uniref:Uncharacterized protein n=1 Tax=Puccinia sorghi TaxID=27349 RepID=A0A0L6VBY5_9BASI|nr:hypothetical protein VP01_2001g2 [Puccinia sorghi]